jgi:hypothetical protein
MLLVAGGLAAGVFQGDVNTLDDLTTKVGDPFWSSEVEALQESEDKDPPPTSKEASGSNGDAAKNKAMASKTQTPPANSTQAAGGAFDVPPVFGGQEGDLLFAVSAVPAATAAQGAAGKSAKPAELGEALAQPVVLPAAGPKAHRDLFDLKPLFMGIQADRMRRRSILGGKCVLSLKELIYGRVCKQQKNGVCTFYDMTPMSVAMKTLFKNAQTNYCKNSTCDASLCYTYGGPVDPKTGLELKQHHEMVDYPIWLPYNRTAVVNGTQKTQETVITQSISFKMALEKVTFCEKLSPALQTEDGLIKTHRCFSSRSCKMQNLRQGKCHLASDHVEPPQEVGCPTEKPFTDKVKASVGSISPTLCSQL